MSATRLEKLLEMEQQEPGDLFITYALGMEYLGMGKTEKALDRFNRVVLADPAHTAALYQLGMIHTRSGNESMAVQCLEQGLSAASAKGDVRSQREFRAALDELL